MNVQVFENENCSSFNLSIFFRYDSAIYKVKCNSGCLNMLKIIIIDALKVFK